MTGQHILGPTSHYFYSQRLKLHYVDWGNPGKPLLVLIHGGRDHCRNWDWVAQALRGDYHIVAPDLRGHGDSEWARGSEYSMIDHVVDIAQLLAQLDLFPVTVDWAFSRRWYCAPVCRCLSRKGSQGRVH